MEPEFTLVWEKYVVVITKGCKYKNQKTGHRVPQRKLENSREIQGILCGSQIFLCGPLWANISLI
jgi:hypothetical protein